MWDNILTAKRLCSILRRCHEKGLISPLTMKADLSENTERTGTPREVFRLRAEVSADIL